MVEKAGQAARLRRFIGRRAVAEYVQIGLTLRAAGHRAHAGVEIRFAQHVEYERGQRGYARTGAPFVQMRAHRPQSVRQLVVLLIGVRADRVAVAAAGMLHAQPGQLLAAQPHCGRAQHRDPLHVAPPVFDQREQRHGHAHLDHVQIAARHVGIGRYALALEHGENLRGHIARLTNQYHKVAAAKRPKRAGLDVVCGRAQQRAYAPGRDQRLDLRVLHV